MRPGSTIAFALASSAAALACSSHDAGGSHETYPAFAVVPAELQRGAGPVLVHPKVVPVLTAGDADTARIESFFHDPVVADALANALAEYGVDKMTVGTSIVLADAPSAIDDATIQSSLTNDATTYPADPEVVYVFLYPSSTATTRDGLRLCDLVGGYHDAVARSGGGKVAYAVVPRCDKLGFYTGLDALTFAAGHELAEAFTDPYVNLGEPGLVALDDAHLPLALVLDDGGAGIEIADLCIPVTGHPRETSRAGGWLMPRLWSNATAKLGRDPCGGASPYVGVDPVVTTTTQGTFSDLAQAGLPATRTIPAVTVRAGATAAVKLRAFSDAPAVPWPVRAIETTDLTKPRQFPVTLDRDQAQNGDELTLSVAPGAGLAPGLYVVGVFSFGAVAHVAGVAVNVTAP